MDGSSRNRWLITACILTLGSSPTAAGRWEQGACIYALADVTGAPRFEHYPATRRTGAIPLRPVLASAEARRYRAMLSRGAAEGPNFAGGFTIVRWGCGSACVDWAIIDASSGRVFFPTGLRTLVNVHGQGEKLGFRPDSRLLIAVGAPGEVERREGVRYLEWTGARLRQIRFVPTSELCGQ